MQSIVTKIPCLGNGCVISPDRSQSHTETFYYSPQQAREDIQELRKLNLILFNTLTQTILEDLHE